MATTTSANDLALDARTLAIHASSVGIDIEMNDIRVYAGTSVPEVIADLMASMKPEQDSLVTCKVVWSHRTKTGNLYTPSLTVVGL